MELDIVPGACQVVSWAGQATVLHTQLSSSQTSDFFRLQQRVCEFSCAAVAQAPEAARALAGSEARTSFCDVKRTGLCIKLDKILLSRLGDASEVVGVARALDG